MPGIQDQNSWDVSPNGSTRSETARSSPPNSDRRRVPTEASVLRRTHSHVRGSQTFSTFSTTAENEPLTPSFSRSVRALPERDAELEGEEASPGHGPGMLTWGGAAAAGPRSRPCSRHLVGGEAGRAVSARRCPVLRTGCVRVLLPCASVIQ